jgi:tellurite resistance protein
MKLTEVKKQHDLLKSLNDEQVTAIFELIDLKTEQDMEKTLQQLELIRAELKADNTNFLRWIIATIVAASGLIIAIIKL